MIYTVLFFPLQNAVYFIIPTYLVPVLFTFYMGTEYFKHDIYSPFFSSSKCSLFHNSNVFGSCIIHILYTGVLKLKKNSGLKRLTVMDPCVLPTQCIRVVSVCLATTPNISSYSRNCLEFFKPKRTVFTARYELST